MTHGLPLIAAAFTMLGCDRPPTVQPQPAAVIAVLPQTATLAAGTAAQFVAQVNDAGGHPIGGAEIRFAVSTPLLLSVTEAGLVRALGPLGAGKLIVTDGALRTEAEITIVPGVLASMEKVRGDGQTGEIGSRLPIPVQVRLADGTGNPVVGALVHFESADGGVAGPGESSSGPNGNATTGWTLGDRAGVQTLKARASEDRGPAVVFSATALAGPAASVTPQRMADRAVAGSSLTAEVKVVDRAGNAKRDVVVVWKVVRGGGQVDTNSSRTNVDGLALVNLTTDPVAGLNQVEARAADLPEAPAQLVVTTAAGPAARVVAASGARQRSVSANAAAENPGALVQDRNGNPVHGAVVTFKVTEGAGRIENPVAITDGRGLARCGPWVLGPGSNVVEASIDGATEPAIFRATGK